MKKENFGREDIISVYQFMEMCGLKVEKKPNICISHNIMLKKLALRHREFPTKVECPVRIPYSIVKKELVKQGYILLVEDELGTIIPYRKLKKNSLSLIFNLASGTREEIRNKIIEEQENNSDSRQEEMKPGYSKYLYRRDKKRQLAEDEWLTNLLEEEQKVIPFEVTQKKNRQKVMHKKVNYR